MNKVIFKSNRIFPFRHSSSCPLSSSLQFPPIQNKYPDFSSLRSKSASIHIKSSMHSKGKVAVNVPASQAGEKLDYLIGSYNNGVAINKSMQFEDKDRQEKEYKLLMEPDSPEVLYLLSVLCRLCSHPDDSLPLRSGFRSINAIRHWGKITNIICDKDDGAFKNLVLCCMRQKAKLEREKDRESSASRKRRKIKTVGHTESFRKDEVSRRMSTNDFAIVDSFKIKEPSEKNSSEILFLPTQNKYKIEEIKDGRNRIDEESFINFLPLKLLIG